MVHHIWDNYPLIQSKLKQVKSIMLSELSVIHPDVKRKILGFIDAPGKYIRSGLTLLFSIDETGQIPEGKLYLAAYVETLHLATLIHDDVIDEADTRRGLDVLNKTFSNRIAVYAGDYLLSYANRLALKGAELLNVSQESNQFFNPMIIERILAGELAQLMNQYRDDMTMKDYLKQIKGKTAFLFALSCQLGAWYPDITKKESLLAFQIGQNIGMAFQLSDDLIDYQIDSSQSGKPRLQDLKNGIYTAPYLLAKQGSQNFRNYIKTIDLNHLNEEERTQIYQLLVTEGYIKQTEQLILTYINKIEQLVKRSKLIDGYFNSFIATIMKRNF